MQMKIRLCYDRGQSWGGSHIIVSVSLVSRRQNHFLRERGSCIAVEILRYVRQSVQLLSCVRLFVTPWTAACQASLSITNSRRLLKLMSIESVMTSNYLILCHPLLLLPLVFPSIRVFSKESVFTSGGQSIRVSSSASEYSGLISFRIDWKDLLADQGTLKSLLQHHSSKASILWCSAFFMVQFSHPYMTTGKIHSFV